MSQEGCTARIAHHLKRVGSMAMEATESKKKVELATVLLGTIVVLLVAVLTAGIQLYGETVKNGTKLLALEKRIDNMVIPPDWFKQVVSQNSRDISELKSWAERHKAEFKAIEARESYRGRESERPR